MKALTNVYCYTICIRTNIVGRSVFGARVDESIYCVYTIIIIPRHAFYDTDFTTQVVHFNALLDFGLLFVAIFYFMSALP